MNSFAGAEPASVMEKPPLQFRVLETRSVEIQGRTTVLNRVAPPVLPPEPATPAQETAASDAFDAAHPAKKTAILFLSATVYDRKVTQISFFGTPGKGAIFSNIDFNLLDGMGNFETDDTVYALMLAVSNQSAEDAAVRNQRLAAQGAEMAWARIPQVGEFNATRSECIVVEDAAHQAPTGEELAALNALHVYFDVNKQQLAGGYAQREATRAEEARQAQEHPPASPDIVIHYWKNEPATIEPSTEGQAR